jgi:hypothetical protein
MRGETKMKQSIPLAGLVGVILSAFALSASGQNPWVVFEGKDGPGKGKHVVLISGDEEYRSEESMPMLGKLLAEKHGFKATVLFAVDPKTGEINPKTLNNIPGIEALDSADLMIICTRFRALPDDKMKHVDDYLKAGKPVIGFRTATHAFNGLKGEYERYNYNYKGDQKEWGQGFGRLVLGETWISHHGDHKSQSTRAVFAPGAREGPLLNGIKDGEIWGATDVYGVRLPLPESCKVLLLGQVVARKGPAKKAEEDLNYGMSPSDDQAAPPKADAKTGKVVDKNDPMMPIAWTKSYQVPGGKAGRTFVTTMGSSGDFTNEGLRRLIVNAAYWLVDLKAPEKAEVGIVGEYKPTAFGFDGFKKGMKPADYQK